MIIVIATVNNTAC